MNLSLYPDLNPEQTLWDNWQGFWGEWQVRQTLSDFIG
jgi:hypothetical protein